MLAYKPSMLGASYREILKSHLSERMENNARYSLRAFSRDLSISPSRLSEILNGKQGLSAKWAKKIANRLQLSSSETDDFCQRVIASDARAGRVRREAMRRLEQAPAPTVPEILEEETFKVIADWYHFALLELTKVKGFRAQPRWISRRLGISEYEAKLAIERLSKLGLLRKKGNGLELTKRSLTTPRGVPSDAIRRFNRQILAKANEAISLQSINERDFSTLTVAVRKADLAFVADRIKAFRRSLDAELSAISGPADEVYSLAMQFFRLTTKGKK